MPPISFSLTRRLLLALFLAVAAAATVAALTVVNCGGEGEARCTVSDPEFALTAEFCDRGLTNIAGTCHNSTRRIAFVDDWAEWALRNQEVLAIDEPINWVSRLATHNAYNNWQDGYPAPNQWWSLTDQLRLGSRLFQLDLHWFNGAVRLCHGSDFGPADHAGCSPFDRLYPYAMKEIRNWLLRDENSDQVLTIDFEDRSEVHSAEVNGAIQAYVAEQVFTPSMWTNTQRQPTFREILSSKRRLVLFSGQETHGGTWIHDLPAFNFPSGLQVDSQQPIGNPTPANLRLDPINAECVTGAITNNQNPTPPSLPGFHVFANNFNLFAWVAEDRSPLGPGAGVLPGDPTDAYLLHRHVERAVRCGIGLVFLDDYAKEGSVQWVPDDFRHWSGIWSWEPGDSGQRGDAAVLKAQAMPGSGGSWHRWASRNTNDLHRFLCGVPRSESDRDPLKWKDRTGASWRITAGTGRWDEGGLRCFEEFGEDWVFQTPVSGYMNVRASIAAAGLGDIWLNYNDIKQEKDWVINQRPVAVAGPDQLLECTSPSGATAHLDASASSDPENDTLKFRWTGDAIFSTNPKRDVNVPMGTKTFQVVVDDHFSGVRADTMQVTVQDTVGPVIERAVPSRATLWPPNGTMAPVSFDVVARDVCSTNVNCRVIAVTSNEDNLPRGNSVRNGPDATITGPLAVELRAERLGKNSGRVYTVTIRCTDTAGNSTDRNVLVTVPHDQGK